MAEYVYAYVCPDCRHLATKHRLAEGGSLIEGPYVCPCGCSRWVADCGVTFGVPLLPDHHSVGRAGQ